MLRPAAQRSLETFTSDARNTVWWCLPKPADVCYFTLTDEFVLDGGRVF